jgi:hypothetical protein
VVHGRRPQANLAELGGGMTCTIEELKALKPGDQIRWKDRRLIGTITKNDATYLHWKEEEQDGFCSAHAYEIGGHASNYITILQTASSKQLEICPTSCTHQDIRDVWVGEWINVCHTCKQEI